MNRTIQTWLLTKLSSNTLVLFALTFCLFLLQIGLVNAQVDNTGGAQRLTAPASCTIPAGSSLCVVSVGIPADDGPLLYDLLNTTRSVTTRLPFSGSFFFNPALTDDTAAHITHGPNTIQLRTHGASFVFSSTVVNGVCAAGSSWSDGRCRVPFDPYAMTVDASCVIPLGGSLCRVAVSLPQDDTPVSYDLRNVTRNVTTRNAFNFDNRFTFFPAPTDNTAAHITHGLNTLETIGSNIFGVLSSVTVRGVCAVGTAWDAASSRCLVPAASFTSTPTCVINPGQSSCVSSIAWTSSAVQTVSLKDCANGIYQPSVGPGPRTGSVTVPGDRGCYKIVDNANNRDLVSVFITPNCASGSSWNQSSRICTCPAGQSVVNNLCTVPGPTTPTTTSPLPAPIPPVVPVIPPTETTPPPAPAEGPSIKQLLDMIQVLMAQVQNLQAMLERLQAGQGTAPVTTPPAAVTSPVSQGSTPQSNAAAASERARQAITTLRNIILDMSEDDPRRRGARQDLDLLENRLINVSLLIVAQQFNLAVDSANQITREANDLIARQRTGGGLPMPLVCTQEARICPDGSSVGRTGPNCEFAACPTASGLPVSTTPPPVSPAVSQITIQAPDRCEIAIGRSTCLATISLPQGRVYPSFDLVNQSRSPITSSNALTWANRYRLQAFVGSDSAAHIRYGTNTLQIRQATTPGVIEGTRTVFGICAGGSVWSSQNRCDCPVGTSARNGQCVSSSGDGGPGGGGGLQPDINLN